MGDENKYLFRTLNADEIEARVGTLNKGGATLLLYKNARADQGILDGSVGPMNWQCHYSRDNANCVVSIKNTETGEWIEKEDTGVESNTEKEKGLASDSFKRACVKWGIGRELYTAPNIFIPRDKLKNFKEEGGKFKCYDSFKVEAVSYSDRTICQVTIGVYEYGKKYATFTFKNDVTAKPTSSSQTATTPTPVEKPTAVKPAEKPASKPATPSSGLTDDEVILIGNCKGKKYGEVKDTDIFAAFMRWLKNTNTSYPDPAQQDQYKRLKELAA